MKRVIYILCLVCILLNWPKCNCLMNEEFVIANSGYDYSDYLINGSEYHVGDNIDWSSDGIYFANYYNENDDSFKKKNVIITSHEHLQNRSNYYFNYLQTNYNMDYQVIKSIFINQSDFVTIGNIYHDNNYNTQFELTYPYIQYYQNEELIWEHILDLEIGSFSDFVLTDYGILVLGNIVRKSDNQNIIVYEFSYEGKLLRQKEFNGEGYDSGKRIFLKDDMLMIVGQSSSNQNDYPKRQTSNIMVIFINMLYSNFNFFEMDYYGNDGYNYPVDSVMIEEDLYALIKLGGTSGYFKSSKESFNNYALLKLNKYLDLSSYYIFEEIGTYEGIVNSGTEIIVIINSLKNSQNIIKFLKLDYGLTFNEIINYTYPEDDCFLYDFKIEHNRDTLYILGEINSLSKTQVMGYAVLGFDKNLDNIYHEKLDEDKNARGILIERSSIYIYGISNNKFYWDYCFYVDVNPLTQEVKINNLLLTSQPIYKINNIDYNIFGKYQLHQHHTLDNFSVFNTQELVIKPNINIRSNEIYDLGVKLEFNGKAYLNDYPIESGFVVNEKGKYLLEVVGKDERKLINFSVDTLSITPKEIEEEKSLITTPSINSPQISNKYDITFNELTSPKVKANNSIFIVLSVGLICVLAGWYLPSKKGKNQVQDEKV